MISMVRRRLTYTNVLLTLVFVFAMSGGAYAASKYVITSTKQISPKVLKSLVGKAGAQGKEGSAGKEGVPGKDGATGKEGTPGKEGSAGKEGPQGLKGETGAPGPKGATGATGPAGVAGKEGTTGFTRTLPPEETETGTFFATIQGVTEGFTLSPISFAIPLKLPLDAANIHIVPNCENLTGKRLTECEAEKKIVEPICPGTAVTPKAEPGNLCVYQNARQEPAGTEEFLMEGVFRAGTGNITASGADTSGAMVLVGYRGPVGMAYTYGTWAVTAPSP